MHGETGKLVNPLPANVENMVNS